MIAKNVLQRGVNLGNYPAVLEMTSEEISKMNEKFGFTQKAFEGAQKKLAVRCEILSQ